MNDMKNNTGPDTIRLYADKLISVTPNAITFRWYYFWGSKTVAVADIAGIESMKPDILNGQWRIWGSSHWNAWMPLDWSRPSRDRIYYLHYKNKSFRIGFTLENSTLAESAFRQSGLMKQG